MAAMLLLSQDEGRAQESIQTPRMQKLAYIINNKHTLDTITKHFGQITLDTSSVSKEQAQKPEMVKRT